MKRLPGLLFLLFVLLSCSLPLPVATPATPTETPTLTPATPSITPSPTIIPTPTRSFWLSWTSSGDNLALKKRVTVSRETYGHGGAAAVDGNRRTSWSSGAGPVQWIEIDLAGSYDIAEIHLIPAQFKPGVTLHRILGRGPFASEFEILYTFNSQVSDSPLLAYASSAAWQGVRIIRIETTYSASAIGWKEVEIMRAEH